MTGTGFRADDDRSDIEQDSDYRQRTGLRQGNSCRILLLLIFLSILLKFHHHLIITKRRRPID
jgi:hypothetical protein